MESARDGTANGSILAGRMLADGRAGGRQTGRQADRHDAERRDREGRRGRPDRCMQIGAAGTGSWNPLAAAPTTVKRSSARGMSRSQGANALALWAVRCNGALAARRTRT